LRTRGEPIPFAGSVLTNYRHVCAFFRSPDEEYNTLLPFMLDGLGRGERAYHVLRSEYGDQHLQRLRGAGVDVPAARQRGQLEVAIVEETYLRGGRFDPDAMLALIEETLKAGTARGFPLTRLIAHVAEKILEDWSNADEWIKYEARLNEVLPAYDDPVICTYDTNLITGTIALDVLRTHPVAIVGGLLHENPFFVSPHAILDQFQDPSGAHRKP
jgi:MEDS: MEthanogen/methylotroph, DcmR Sensory domain